MAIGLVVQIMPVFLRKKGGRNIYKNKRDFHIRKYKVKKRPNLIVGEEGNNFEYMQFTHSRKQGRKSNIKLDKNINKNDGKNCYIQKKIYINKKNRFGSKNNDLYISDNDLDKIIAWLNKKFKK